MLYNGWIEAVDVQTGASAIEEERAFLESLGIRLGPWIASDGCFDDCDVPLSSLARLKPLEGRFIWGLD